MNFHSDEWIREKLKEHWEELKTYYPEDNRVLGIFLCGSQNYGLDTESSDVDTKAIIFPAFEDIVFNWQPTSFTYTRENDEHIEVKDIRLMFHTLKKHNINFVETLFTDYFIINPTYACHWNALLEYREEFAKCNPIAFLDSTMGQIRQRHKQLYHRNSDRQEVINEKGYDPKGLATIIRLSAFIKDFCSDRPYKKCLVPEKFDEVFVRHAKEAVWSYGSAKAYAKYYVELAEEYYKNFKENHTPNEDKRLYAEGILDCTQWKLMQQYLKLVLM